VVVNPGLGDMDELLAAGDCGVVVRGRSDEDIDHAAENILRLVDDDGTPARCRALAAQHFDVERGVERLLAAYHDALG
jgi:glycosyltransferase involved in cell wall biosynthesis